MKPVMLFIEHENPTREVTAGCLYSSRNLIKIASNNRQLAMILKMFRCNSSIGLPIRGGSMHGVYLHVKSNYPHLSLDNISSKLVGFLLI